MERCLTWGHLAPTALDTLGYSPNTDTDCLVLLTMPDVFIAGNQPRYMARKTEIHGHQVLLGRQSNQIFTIFNPTRQLIIFLSFL